MTKRNEKENSSNNKKNIAENVENSKQSRREFLYKAWKGLGVIAAVQSVFVFFSFLFSGKRNPNSYKPRQLIDAGPVDDFSVNSVTVFSGARFYLTRLADGGFIALSLRCTHLGCSVQWEEDKNRFICPCHSSSFSINGDVQNPPAPKALDHYPVLIENGIVKVDIGHKLERDKFSKEQVTYA